MKTYEIRGGYNVTEQYETTVKANSKEAKQSWTSNTILPLLVLIEDRLNEE